MFALVALHSIESDTGEMLTTLEVFVHLFQLV
jgi:hypothetical protein